MSEISIINLDDDMLQALDDVLHCRMCKGYYTYCVMAVCGHNYCSHCIRKRMRANQDCPFCYEDIQEADLRNNKLVDKMVRIYEKLKLKSKSKITQEKSAEKSIKIEESFESVSYNDEDTQMEDISSDSFVINTSHEDNSSRNSMIISSNMNNTTNEDDNSTKNSMIISSNMNNTANVDSNKSTRNSMIISSNVNQNNRTATNAESDLNISNDLNVCSNPSINTETCSSDELRENVVRCHEKTIQSLEECRGMIKVLVAHCVPSRGKDLSPVNTPFTTVEEVLENEKWLSDESNRDSMVNYLSLFRGNSASETVRNVLRKIFSSRLAKSFNWVGRGEKQSFATLTLKEVVIRTVLKSQDAPITFIEEVIKRWLRNQNRFHS